MHCPMGAAACVLQFSHQSSATVSYQVKVDSGPSAPPTPLWPLPPLSMCLTLSCVTSHCLGGKTNRSPRGLPNRIGCIPLLPQLHPMRGGSPPASRFSPSAPLTFWVPLSMCLTLSCVTSHCLGGKTNRSSIGLPHMIGCIPLLPQTKTP